MAILTESQKELLAENGSTIIREKFFPENFLIDLNQQVGGLINFQQSVKRFQEKQILFPVAQSVGIGREEETLATFDQTTIFVSEFQKTSLLQIDQNVERVATQARILALRQINLLPQSSGQVGAELSPVIIRLDGEEISELCDNAFSVTGTESENRVAQVTYFPPEGPLNIPSYQGRELEIDRLQAGGVVALFRGVVDVPTYDRYRRALIFRCSDLRNEKIGNEAQDALLSITGGTYSEVVQREDATGAAWVRELMKTVPGSLDYAGDGALRYRPWALGAPKFTLGGAAIHHREINMEFATRIEIVNVVNARIEYRYFKRNETQHNIDLEVGQSEFCNGEVCLPSGQLLRRSAVQQAVQGIGDWFPTNLTYKPAPAAGWYTGPPSTARPGGEKVAYVINDIVRAAYCLGFELSLSKYISQPKREVYELSYLAPESTNQFGAIQGSSMRFALETRVDPDIYEERGCVIVSDPDDRRQDLNAAIESIRRMAVKEILESHRKNFASFRCKPARGEPGNATLLPVEIGDSIRVETDELTVTGWVTEFNHQQTKTGDLWTDVKLAVSTVDSSASVTEDWTLPAEPTSYQLAPREPGQLETPDCPAPTGDESLPEETGFEDGNLTITTPSIDRRYVDEITGLRGALYQVKIPVDPFEVSVVR